MRNVSPNWGMRNHATFADSILITGGGGVVSQRRTYDQRSPATGEMRLGAGWIADGVAYQAALERAGPAPSMRPGQWPALPDPTRCLAELRVARSLPEQSEIDRFRAVLGGRLNAHETPSKFLRRQRAKSRSRLSVFDL